MKSSQFLAVCCTVLLGGCAIITTPVKLASSGKSKFEGAVYSGQTTDLEAPVSGAERYRVFQQGETGFVSVQSVLSEVEETATDFCNQKSKAMHAISKTTSKPPHILGNFPRAELVFQCTNRPNAKPSQAEGNKYDKLAALKKLLDSGALTQQEFEGEKVKLLVSP